MNKKNRFGFKVGDVLRWTGENLFKIAFFDEDGARVRLGATAGGFVKEPQGLIFYHQLADCKLVEKATQPTTTVSSWSFEASAANPPNLWRILTEADEEGLKAVVVRCGTAERLFVRKELGNVAARLGHSQDNVAVGDAGIIRAELIDRAKRPVFDDRSENAPGIVASDWMICNVNSAAALLPAVREAIRRLKKQTVSVEGVVG